MLMTQQGVDPNTEKKQIDEARESAAFTDLLVKYIAHKPSGVSVSEIERAQLVHVTRRTLQRMLARLVSEGTLHKAGQGKGTRYFVGEQGLEATGGYTHTLVCDYSSEGDAYLPDALRTRFRALNRALRAHHTDALAHGNDALMPELFPYWSFDLIWNSSRLLNVEYTQDEAERLLKTGQPVEGRLAHDSQAILNHASAVALIQECTPAVTELVICNLHAILTDNLHPDPGAGGRLRPHPYVSEPRDPHVVLSMLVEKSSAIDDPFEQSFFLFMHLSFLRLFPRGNMRLARVAANLPLLRADMCPITFVGTPLPLYVHALREVGAGLRYHVLRDFYAQVYEEGCAHYGRQPVPGTVDPLRLEYRHALKDLVRWVVQNRMPREQAMQWMETQEPEKAPQWLKTQVPQKAGQLPLPAAVYTLAMQELDALHAGNIYRYGLSGHAFARWKETWRQARDP